MISNLGLISDMSAKSTSVSEMSAKPNTGWSIEINTPPLTCFLIAPGRVAVGETAVGTNSTPLATGSYSLYLLGVMYYIGDLTVTGFGRHF